jgi:serine/threonine protein kinase
MQELYKNILSAKYKSIPKIYSKNLNEIIDLMLIKDPLKRPSADDLLNNKIILEKKKELNLKNDDNDESSYINKAVDKIIKDYHNNKNKLENSHIIYKKMEKNNIKNNINHKNNNSINNF